MHVRSRLVEDPSKTKAAEESVTKLVANIGMNLVTLCSADLVVQQLRGRFVDNPSWTKEAEESVTVIYNVSNKLEFCF